MSVYRYCGEHVDISVCRCIGILICRYIDIAEHGGYVDISVYQYIGISVCRYVDVSICCCKVAKGLQHTRQLEVSADIYIYTYMYGYIYIYIYNLSVAILAQVRSRSSIALLSIMAPFLSDVEAAWASATMSNTQKKSTVYMLLSYAKSAPQLGKKHTWCDKSFDASKEGSSDDEDKPMKMLDGLASAFLLEAEALRLDISSTIGQPANTLHNAINLLRKHCDDGKLIKHLNQLNDAASCTHHFDHSLLRGLRGRVANAVDLYNAAAASKQDRNGDTTVDGERSTLDLSSVEQNFDLEFEEDQSVAGLGFWCSDVCLSRANDDPEKQLPAQQVYLQNEGSCGDLASAGQVVTNGVSSPSSDICYTAGAPRLCSDPDRRSPHQEGSRAGTNKEKAGPGENPGMVKGASPPLDDTIIEEVPQKTFASNAVKGRASSPQSSDRCRGGQGDPLPKRIGLSATKGSSESLAIADSESVAYELAPFAVVPIKASCNTQAEIDTKLSQAKVCMEARLKCGRGTQQTKSLQ